MVYSVRLDRGAAPDPVPVVDPLDRAKQITKPFAGDESLNSWTARMIAAADDFQKNKRTDPLNGYLVTHLR